jgi:hypothetical protein
MARRLMRMTSSRFIPGDRVTFVGSSNLLPDGTVLICTESTLKVKWDFGNTVSYETNSRFAQTRIVRAYGKKDAYNSPFKSTLCPGYCVYRVTGVPSEVMRGKIVTNNGTSITVLWEDHNTQTLGPDDVDPSMLTRGPYYHNGT